MKRLFIILLVFAISISAQSIKDGSNSSTTTLDSSAVFTGTVRDVTRYSSISMTVFASDSSATNGLQVQFGDYIAGTFTPMRYYFFTYNSPDSMFTKTLPVSHPYYRVLYTNDTDSLTSFYLVTMLNTGDKLPTTTTGKLDIDGTVTLSQAQIDSLQNIRRLTSADVVGLAGSTNSYATWFSTTGTTIDSASLGFTSRDVTFINDGVSTDTLFVSTSSSFPATNTIKRLGGEGFTKYWATTKLYFKVGTTPLASKKIRVEAN